MTKRPRCPASRTVERVIGTDGRAWCGDCLRWVEICKDGTMRSHPGASGSLGEEGKR